jgi:predicted nucleic acid-binding protein
MLILDSGAVSLLAAGSLETLAIVRHFRDEDLWPPVVPSIVLVECLTGHAGKDAKTNRFLRTCLILEDLPASIARRAAAFRTRAGRGSAVDALVVATAEPGGTVLTADLRDVGALAAHAGGVSVQRI